MTALKDALKDTLTLLENGKTLSVAEMQRAMRLIMEGAASNEDLATFLTLLAKRGETVDEIIGATSVLREKVSPINAPANAIDCCGTGGDGQHTYNISTAVALVTAACGITMAKHGNRAASSKSGAADVLEALGVNLDISQKQAETALADIGFAFLMAPHHHKAMKHVVPVRKALGFRTIFNILGPLANPAGTKRQLIGVFDRRLLVPMAEALKALGTEKAWLVCGADGLDEITVTASTYIARLEKGNITERKLAPAEFGLPLHDAENIKGGVAPINAKALMNLLKGQKSAYRDIVLANSAAVLMIADKATALKEAVSIAAAAIDDGRALSVLEQYREFSNDRS